MREFDQSKAKVLALYRELRGEPHNMTAEVAARLTESIIMLEHAAALRKWTAAGRVFIRPLGSKDFLTREKGLPVVGKGKKR